MENYGSTRPMSAYSRHMGDGMGAYAQRNGRDMGHTNSVFIGRARIAEVRRIT